jgi:ABC-type branched-subunit amino acid transport system ATPase component
MSPPWSASLKAYGLAPMGSQQQTTANRLSAALQSSFTTFHGKRFMATLLKHIECRSRTALDHTRQSHLKFALMFSFSKPRPLLLDQPSLGLAPKMTDYVFGMIGDLRSEGLTIMLVEQKARQTLEFANRAYVLETGRIVMSGTASELTGNAAVSEAFLGGSTRSQSHAVQPTVETPD